MIIIVACGTPRHDQRTLARRMDRRKQFREALDSAHTRTSPNKILIFSAKYGLLGLNDVVEPYTVRLGEEGSVTAEIVSEQARHLSLLPQQEVVEIIGSAKVVSFLSHIFDLEEPGLPEAR